MPAWRENWEQVWRLNVLVGHEGPPRQLRAWYQTSLRPCRLPRQRKLGCGIWRLGAADNCRPVAAEGSRSVQPVPTVAGRPAGRQARAAVIAFRAPVVGSPVGMVMDVR